MLSGAMMFDFMGWKEVAQLIEDGIARTIQQKRVTYDLERLMPGATKVGTSEFATAIIENMKGMRCRQSEACRALQRSEDRSARRMLRFTTAISEDHSRRRTDSMRKKVTVVGGGFVGSTTAQRIVDLRTGRCCADRYSRRASGGQSARHGGVRADHAHRLARHRHFDRRRRLQRHRQQRHRRDHRRIPAQAGHEPRRSSESQLRRDQGRRRTDRQSIRRTRS